MGAHSAAGLAGQAGAADQGKLWAAQDRKMGNLESVICGFPSFMVIQVHVVLCAHFWSRSSFFFFLLLKSKV